MAGHEGLVGCPGREIIGKPATKASNNSMQDLAGFTKPCETTGDSMSIGTFHPCSTMEPADNSFNCIWDDVQINEIKSGRISGEKGRIVILGRKSVWNPKPWLPSYL